MKGELFDHLTLLLGSDMPRRQAFKVMLGLVGQGILFPTRTGAAVCDEDKGRCPVFGGCSVFDFDTCNGNTILNCNYRCREGRCVRGITLEIPCRPPNPHCHEEDGKAQCVQCKEDSHCRDLFGTDVDCCNRSCCPDAKPHCVSRGGRDRCVECGEDSDCEDLGKPTDCCNNSCCPTEKPHCVNKSGRDRCVECDEDSHCEDLGKDTDCCNNSCCPAEKPHCVNKSGRDTCVECKDDDHCADVCLECRNNRCVSRCTARGRTECCKNHQGELGECCKPGCCDPESGECIQPTGNIIESHHDHIVVEVQETHVGLGSIEVVEVENATVEIPAFEDGTTEPVLVIATKVDLRQRSFLLLKASPASSCNCDCDEIVDPVLAQLLIPAGSGNQVTEVFERIPAREHYITVQNGSPGLRRVQIFVNEVAVATRWLRNGSVRFLDVEEWMTQEENVVTVVANGQPGATALFMVADVPTRQEPAKTLAGLPPVAWIPAVSESGQALRWGR